MWVKFLDMLDDEAPVLFHVCNLIFCDGDFLKFLLQRKAITNEEFEHIKKQNQGARKMNSLLNTIRAKGNKEFIVFMKALRNCPEELVQHIGETMWDDAKEDMKFLCDNKTRRDIEQEMETVEQFEFYC